MSAEVTGLLRIVHERRRVVDGELRRTAYPGQPLPDHDIALVRLDDRAWRDVLSAFHGTVTAISLSNPRSRRWWFSRLAARDGANAPLLGDLELAAAVGLTLSATAARSATVRVEDAAVAGAVASAAAAAGWRVVVPRGTRAAWALRRIGSRGRTAAGAARVIGGALRRCRRARAHRTAMPQTADLLVVTRLGGGTVADGRYRDVYFGDLASSLVESDRHAVFTGQLGSPATDAVFAALATPADVPRVSMWQLLGVRDVARGVRAALGRVEVDRAALPSGVSRALVRRALEGDVAGVIEGDLLQRSLERQLRRWPDARVLTLFEGNPWERACDLASASSARRVTGYAHAPIIPSHQKYRFEPDEGGARPQPATIVCTGRAARDALLAIGDRDPSAVVAGCALRLPGLRAREPRGEPPARVERVLVLLDGVPSTVDLLVLVRDAVSALPHGIELTVRAHPDMPFDVVALSAGMTTVPARMRSSSAQSADDDIAACDLVVYQGSSLAYLAGYWGIPLIHVDRNRGPTSDPLAGASWLKRVVRTPAELVEALAAPGWAADGFTGAVAALRAHVDDLYAPPSGDALDALVYA